MEFLINVRHQCQRKRENSKRSNWFWRARLKRIERCVFMINSPTSWSMRTKIKSIFHASLNRKLLAYGWNSLVFSGQKHSKENRYPQIGWGEPRLCALSIRKIIKLWANFFQTFSSSYPRLFILKILINKFKIKMLNILLILNLCSTSSGRCDYKHFRTDYDFNKSTWIIFYIFWH